MTRRRYELAMRCPHCGDPITCAISINGSRGLAAGDVVICLTCGRFAVFDGDGKARAPTEGEAAELAADVLARRMHGLWEMMVAFAPTEGRA